MIFRLIINVIVILLFSMVGSTSAQVTDLLKADSQKVEAKDRVFHPEPKIVFRIDDLNAKAPFVKMADLNVIDDDNIVIWDTKHYYRWSLTDPEDAFRIGAGFGGGPAEYRSPMNAFLHNNLLVSVDDEAFRIQLWDLGTGKFLRDLKLPRRVEGYRIVVDPAGRSAFVLSFLWRGEGQITQIDLNDGRVLGNYLQLPDNKEYKAGYCHDGRLAIDPDGNVYHASNNAGNLTKFKPGNAVHVYNREVISEHKNDCKIVTTKAGWGHFTDRSKEYRPITLDIEYADGKIYLLHSGRNSYASNMVDVYDAASGDYLHTLKLAYAAREIAIVGNAIYAYGFSSANDTYTFTKYELK